MKRVILQPYMLSFLLLCIALRYPSGAIFPIFCPVLSAVAPNHKVREGSAAFISYTCQPRSVVLKQVCPFLIPASKASPEARAEIPDEPWVSSFQCAGAFPASVWAAGSAFFASSAAPPAKNQKKISHPDSELGIY